MLRTWIKRQLEESHWVWVLAALAWAVAVGLYFDAGLFGYCNLDDPEYVSANPLVQSGLSLSSLRQALQPGGLVYWSPLTTISFLVDRHFFGDWAGGFHLVNVLWHSGGVFLFFLLVLRLSGSRFAALLAALLFAVHPVHVDSVAWISARKDVLSTFLGLAAINIYISWARRPGAARNLAFHVLYGLSLLAKPILVILPGLLLLLDFWPLRRLKEDGSAGPWPDLPVLVARLREKTLLLAMGLGITVVTLNTQFAQPSDRLDPDLVHKLANALVAAVKYLGLFVWPSGLAIVHPFPESVPLAQSLGAGALLLALTGLCLWQARPRPFLLVGWLWFLCALAPVIVPPKAGLHVELAERWAYVPYLGLDLAVACLGAELLRAFQGRTARGLAALALILLPVLPLAAAQQRQLATWATPMSIYEQALRVTTGNYLVLSNYGALKVEAGDLETAERCFLEALQAFPEYSACQQNLGLLRLRQGRDLEALELFWDAMLREERLHRAYLQYRAVALTLVRLGKPREALAFYARAVREQPHQPEAYREWGHLAQTLDDKETAQKYFMDAMVGDPKALGLGLTLEDLKAGLARP